MQLNVYDLYLAALDEINIDERGQLNLDRFNRYANKSVRWLVDYLSGRLPEYPDPKLGLLRTQKIADLLTPLLRYRFLSIKNGVCPYPDDYDFKLDLRLCGPGDWTPGECTDLPKFTIDDILSGAGGFRQIEVASHDVFASIAGSRIPSLRAKLVAEQYDGGWSINPKSAGSCFLAYVAAPKVFQLVMQEDPTTHLLSYDSVNSTNPPVNTNVTDVLARRIAQYQMQFVREQEGVQISDAVSKTE